MAAKEIKLVTKDTSKGNKQERTLTLTHATKLLNYSSHWQIAENEPYKFENGEIVSTGSASSTESPKSGQAAKKGSGN